MAEQTAPRAGTTTFAGVLILLLTAAFLVAGIDLARTAIGSADQDREAYLAGLALGLSPQAQANFTGIIAVIVLGLCVLTTVCGIGVLTRREGVRHAAIATFVLFTLVTVPLAIAGLNADKVTGGAWVGLFIGLLDALVLWLLLRGKTSRDFERAESIRRRQRFAREEEQRLARATSRPTGRG